jgi:hypothetical protein
MTPRRLLPIMLAVMLAILAYGMYQQVTNIPVLHAEGRLLMRAEELKGSRDVELATRDIKLAGVRRWQVQMPGGTWIDCEGDCRSAVLRAGPQLWETLQNRSR